MTGAGRAVHNQDTAVRQVIEWHLDNHRPEQLKKKKKGFTAQITEIENKAVVLPRKYVNVIIIHHR